MPRLEDLGRFRLYLVRSHGGIPARQTREVSSRRRNMSATLGASWILVALVLLVLGLLPYALSTGRAKTLPPGPPTVPFLGCHPPA